MAIFLIRHGQTASNAARVIQTPDAPLDACGLLQAERLARRLGQEPISQILSSDYPRAVMTAEPLRAATGAVLRLDPVLEERNYGDIRGLPYDAVGRDIMANDYDPPGGERWQEFHARVDRAWELIRREAERTAGALAVVTHGLVCYSLATRHLQLGPGSVPPLRWGNTSLTVIEARSPWRVELLNDTAHLDGAAADVAPSAI